ncbi:PREDICTED: RING-H2 finger protein ATL38-like [Tarenaya hassleriana]|uniref:RING-H2 finger protein ATL38-like n=1 Tax=Tarenaya hassleriana TaxID=28532 RepID=UPI00053C2E44|nr:PREDICTED: RING-H2 finger protein ATL38-like [Tarenaya hassleriana]
MWEFSIHMIPTMIGFGTSIGFLVYVCTRLVCTKAPSSFHPRPHSPLDVERQFHAQMPTGFEPTVLSAIPTMRFNRDALVSTDDSQCAICLEEYEEEEVMRVMPRCKHKFHAACIDVWLPKHSTCPVCRLPLLSPSL